jgi:hypothetical protein
MEKKWLVGFDKKIITPKDWQKTPYYLAGFDRGVRATGVLDDIYVRSVFLKDSFSDGGVVLAVIDCVGICNKDINEIRTEVKKNLITKPEIDINVMATHVHAAPDTQGLWGKGIRCGINKNHMKRLKSISVECILNSINNVKPGNLFFGKVLTENMILDNRLPFVHDDHLARIHFVPEDKSPELYILNIGCHPELLGDKNTKISADWPAYCGKTIYEATGAEFIYFQGANGAITSEGLSEVYEGKFSGEPTMIAYGKKMGEYALTIKNEIPIDVDISIRCVERILPVVNKTFTLASKLKLVKNDVIKVDALNYKRAVKTEVSLLKIGNIKVLLVPGELFPELALGGFFSAEESATGNDYEYQTLFDMMGDGEKLIFGLANDEIGYIIPDNDFYISEKKPYAFWAIPNDRHGRAHYEETTGSGPFAAEMIREAVEQLIK